MFAVRSDLFAFGSSFAWIGFMAPRLNTFLFTEFGFVARMGSGRSPSDHDFSLSGRSEIARDLGLLTVIYILANPSTEA